MTEPELPGVARRFLQSLVRGPEREYVLGDLAEGFRRRVRTTDLASARRWYRRQALRALPTFAHRMLGDLARKVRSNRPLRGGGHDVRWAFRALRRRPTLLLAGVGTLGLGLGAAAAVLGVADSVWFSPLPFADPDRVVRVFEVDRNPRENAAGSPTNSEDGRRSATSPPLVADLQRHTWSSFEGFAAITPGTFEWSEGLDVRRLSAVVASPNVLAIFGVRPLLGRDLSTDPGTREVLLTEPFWRSAFGAAASVLDRNLSLDGQSYQIVGVIPERLSYPHPADVWAPLHFSGDALSEGMRGARYLDVVARVARTATAGEAARELNAFVVGLADAHPNHRGWGGTVADLRGHLVEPYKPVLLLLLSGAGLFLLIATVNVAGLVAARRADDIHDVTLRAALGASRWRLMRQNLVEALILSGGGAALASVLAIWVLAPVKRLAPSGVPRLGDASIDGTVAALLMGGALVVAAIIAGTGNAVTRLVGTEFIGRGRASNGVRSRGRSALTVIQVAFTTLLLLGGVLIVRYVQQLANVDSGFVADRVEVAPLVAPERRYPEGAQRLAFFQDVIDRLGQRGLTAAVGSNPPISGVSMRFGYRPGGWETEQYWAQYHATSADYFDVLSIPMVAGRSFTPADDDRAPPVVIVNEYLAGRHFPEGALGRRIIVVGELRTIVGVVGSTRHFGPDQDPPPEMYVPLAQDPAVFAHVLVSAADGVAPGILQEVVRRIDPGLLVTPLAPFTDLVAAWFAPLRFQLVIIGLFGILGTILAAVGLYALVAYLVASRTREIGIRVALGAPQPSVFVGVVRAGLIPVGVGVGTGTATALAGQRIIQSLVTGIDPNDPVAYLSVVVGMGLVAALACAVPARRAAAVDPVIALRSE